MEYDEEIDLKITAALCRRDALDMVHTAGSGHLGGSFSVMDMLTVLYFSKMSMDPARADDPDRDRCVLSKGHCTPAMYSVLSRRGYFPHHELATFRRIDGNLSGHVEMTKVPGVDMSAGSLGQGLSAALGMALAGRIDGRGYQVYCICGDGEIQEGQIWEAAQVAGHYGLANLTAIIDDNGIQLDGFTDQVSGPPHISEKFGAFGWKTIEIDGHDIPAIRAALDQACRWRTGPTAIVAHTVKGKGVSFMENEPRWHGGTPSEQEYAVAAAELDRTVDHLRRMKKGEAR